MLYCDTVIQLCSSCTRYQKQYWTDKAKSGGSREGPAVLIAFLPLFILDARMPLSLSVINISDKFLMLCCSCVKVQVY